MCAFLRVMSYFRWWTGGDGGRTEQWESDVCLLPDPGCQLWGA